MANLIIDSGNTAIKMFVFDSGEIVKNMKCNQISEMLPALEKSELLNKITKCIISSVSYDQNLMAKMLLPYFKVTTYSKSLSLPIINKYKTPETLGSDRIAAVVGAVHKYPKRNILVIDSGTAITYDIVTDLGEYLGGNISLGLNTRFKALHNFTKKLPLLQCNMSENSLFGTNTTEAITIGIQNGMLYEIETTIEKFRSKFNSLLVIFTGGDSIFFEDKIKNCNFAEPYLVAFGLNEILEYNA